MTAITRYRGDTDPISGVVSLNDLPLNVTGCSFVLTVDPSKTPAEDTKAPGSHRMGTRCTSSCRNSTT